MNAIFDYAKSVHPLPCNQNFIICKDRYFYIAFGVGAAEYRVPSDA